MFSSYRFKQKKKTKHVTKSNLQVTLVHYLVVQIVIMKVYCRQELRAGHKRVRELTVQVRRRVPGALQHVAVRAGRRAARARGRATPHAAARHLLPAILLGDR